jgi:GT2 family glycosyltransferase
MPELEPSDVTVIIPSRDRWEILHETLGALRRQSVEGFRVTVVVDGLDQDIPELAAHQVLVKQRGGPGAARNLGVQECDTPLVLFLGDDILPTESFVARHLAGHNRRADDRMAVLGHTAWDPRVAGGIHNRWLDWSGSQFDYAGIAGRDAGWGRFYSSNVSLKKVLFEQAGGFDPRFTFDYEDLDLAYRLHSCGMTLEYERSALAHHLHSYDWSSLVRRYHSRGLAERLMADKNEWFEPWFKEPLVAATRRAPVSAVWPRLAAIAPSRPKRLKRRLERVGTSWYHQHLAGPFLGAWHATDGIDELRSYLGEDFDERNLLDHRVLVDREEADKADDAEFYRTSKAYLYDLTMFSIWGTKEPYRSAIRRLVPPGSRLLDYGCGIGSDGLRLIDEGYDVSFADFDNPSTRYLRWRLQQRGLSNPVHDVDGDVPGGFDAVYCFDVIEHVDDPFRFLDHLEERGGLIVVNFLESHPDETHLHRPLPIRRLLAHAARHGLVFYRRFERRSHLVAYRSPCQSRKRVLSSVGELLRGSGEALVEDLVRLPPAL